MVELFEREQGKPLYPLWLLLLATGLRPGEVLVLKWADLEGDTLRIQRTLVRKPEGGYHVVEQKAPRPTGLFGRSRSPSACSRL